MAMPIYKKIPCSEVRTYQVSKDEVAKAESKIDRSPNGYSYPTSQRFQLCVQANDILADNGYNPITAEKSGRKQKPVMNEAQVRDWLNNILKK